MTNVPLASDRQVQLLVLARKNFFADDLRPFPATPQTWGEMVASLVDGQDPPPYAPGDWPAPACAPFERPKDPYAVLHVGASTPLKQWPAERWREVAQHLSARGLAIVWSAGKGEEPLVAACDPEGRHANLAGRLDLAQLWNLLAGARLLVVPDTGVAHLARITFTPTVALFGPGSPVIVGSGPFWSRTPWSAAWIDPFDCRDQRILFRREIAWVRRCGRTTRECPAPRCLLAVDTARVVAEADALLATTGTPAPGRSLP